jgi:hypothetical protein
MFLVLVRDGGEWDTVGSGFRQPNGGWNVEFKGAISAIPVVLADNRGFAPGELLRLFVTRPGLRGGTDWFEVGTARVTGQGRSVLMSVDTVLPHGVNRLVILPKKKPEAQAG